MFQSTHPRGVRPCRYSRYTATWKVSIHAPAWGATLFPIIFSRLWDVSIHAPAWGATPNRTSPNYSGFLFQSTHPRGVRPVHAVHAAPHSPVSIHAPAWGATSAQARAARAGFWFQSTHPRGVRRCISSPSPRTTGSFNPRTRVGCDRVGMTALGWVFMFQSTHPRGVRLLHGCFAAHAGLVSIHAPAWGATPAVYGILGPYLRVSIHAPAWGATRWSWQA